MNQQGFEDYTHFVYGHTTGTANSYIMAILILDRIFATEDSTDPADGVLGLVRKATLI